MYITLPFFLRGASDAFPTDPFLCHLCRLTGMPCQTRFDSWAAQALTPLPSLPTRDCKLRTSCCCTDVYLQVPVPWKRQESGPRRAGYRGEEAGHGAAARDESKMKASGCGAAHKWSSQAKRRGRGSDNSSGVVALTGSHVATVVAAAHHGPSEPTSRSCSFTLTYCGRERSRDTAGRSDQQPIIQHCTTQHQPSTRQPSTALAPQPPAHWPQPEPRPHMYWLTQRKPSP